MATKEEEKSVLESRILDRPNPFSEMGADIGAALQTRDREILAGRGGKIGNVPPQATPAPGSSFVSDLIGGIDVAKLSTTGEMFNSLFGGGQAAAASGAPPVTPPVTPDVTTSPTGIAGGNAGRPPSQPVQVPGGGSNAQAPFVPSEANNYGVTVARGLDIQRPGDPRQSAGDYALSEQGIRGAIDYSTRRAADANMAFASRLKKMASRLAGNKNITPAMAQAVLSAMATRFRPSAGTGLAAQGLASSASRYASDRGVSSVVAAARARRDLNPYQNFVTNSPITGEPQVTQIDKSTGEIVKTPSSLGAFGLNPNDDGGDDLDPNRFNAEAIARAVAKDDAKRKALLDALLSQGI
jgi:hypothetical protein